MPLVSVILPTFNRAATLPRAVHSVLNQTFGDLELIVVDDGSIDETESLVQSVGDPRIRYVRLGANRGAPHARNLGVQESAAEWLAFQDSDDEWLPTKLYEQLRCASAASGDTGLILGGYRIDSPAGFIEILPAETLAGRDPLPDLLDGWPIITPTWLIRRRVFWDLRGFDESYPCLEDWDLVLRLSDRFRVAAVVGPTLVKHGSTDTVCADPKMMLTGLNRILETHSRRWEHHPRRLARRLTHLACLERRLGHTDRARATLRRALAQDPLAPPIWGLAAAALAGPRAFRFAERQWPRYSGMAP